jgi:hypothetical protein
MGLGGNETRFRTLQSMSDRVGSRLGTIGALCLIKNVPHMRCNGIQTDRQYEGNVLVGTAEGEQTQNLHFARSKIVWKPYAIPAAMQQGIDVVNQACHSNSTREMFGFPQLLHANPPLRVGLSCYEKGPVTKQSSGKPGPRAHRAIERYRVLEVRAGEIRPVCGASEHRQVEFGGAEAYGSWMVGCLPCVGP